MPRTSDAIKHEIEEKFGFFPPFFEPALATPQVLENLWQQTVIAYVNNPLPDIFKEKLNAYLSRYCEVPYCMICHSSALRPLGMSAGAVLSLLEAEPVLGRDIDTLIDHLNATPAISGDFPESESTNDRGLIACAVGVFLEGEQSRKCREALLHSLGTDLFNHLSAYLAYIKTCHTWMAMHPEVSHEADERARLHLGPMLSDEPALSLFFDNYRERVALEIRSRANRLAGQEAEERYRLLVDGARDYAMVMLDKSGNIVHANPGAERILNYKEGELLRQHISVIFTPEDRANGVPQRELDTATTIGRAEDKRWHEKKDGARFWADGVMTSLRDEGGKLRGFAKVMRDATDRKRDEEKLKAKVRLETLTNDINQQTRNLLEPNYIQSAVANSLRNALSTDLCFFLQLDDAINRVHLADDSRRFERADSVIVRGISTVDADALFSLGNTVVVTDTEAPDRAQKWRSLVGVLGRSDIRAFIGTPVYRRNRLVAVLCAAMIGSSRVWTADEVTLTESAAAQTRVAIEAALLQQREHNIAVQLQEALQPELPAATPGLKLTKYYEAALAEAGVGGDFYDVFSVGQARTALIVGDLSGKGLAAATQVATVRNMLRAFLYSRATIAEAAYELNHALVSHRLLTGFATLFVGTFDSANCALTYVNCGQEPALLRLGATGEVKELVHTGPIVGTIDRATYVEQTVSLAPGDAFAIFTDGLTEVGPNRANMIGIEGVSSLFAKQDLKAHDLEAETAVEALALQIISGVDSYAESAVRDDVCLLVGVVT